MPDPVKKDTDTPGGSEKDDVTNQDIVDPRQTDFDDIVAKREEELQSQDQDLDVETDGPEKTDKKPEKEADASAVDTKIDEKDTPDPDKQPVKETVIVDGQEIEVTQEQIEQAGSKKALQLEMAAQKRFDESKTVLQEVKQLRDELKKPSKPDKPTDDDEPPSSDDMTDWDDDKLLDAVRYGEEDIAKQAIRVLRGGQSIKPEDIDKAIDNRMTVRTMASIEDKFQKPEKEGGFADIYSDPFLSQHAGLKVEQLVKSGKDRFDWNTWVEAGTWVRKTILGQETTTPPNKDGKDILENKKDLKRSKTNIDPASKTAKADTDKSSETVSLADSRKATIQEMKEERETGRTGTG